MPLSRPVKTWNAPYAGQRVIDYVTDFQDHGFEVLPAPAEEVAYQLDERLERLKGAGQAGTFAQLTSFVAKAYQRGASLGSLALLAEQRTGVPISHRMIEQLLEEQGVALRKEDPAPFLAVWDERESLDAQLDALEKLSNSSTAFEAMAKDLRAQAQPAVVQILTGSPPWAEARFASKLRSNLAGLHAHSRGKVNGLVFEGVLATSLEEAGYDVSVFTPGNPGADLELALNNQQVLESWSLKSDASKTAKGHGSISMASLAPHRLGHAPKTFAEFEEAREAALAHLGRYERITFLQCVEEPFPFMSEPDEKPETAWRYNVIDVPKDDVEKAVRELGEADFEEARAKQGAVLSIPIRDADGSEMFSLKIGAKAVGIAAVKPAFYEPQLSIWTTPPHVSDQKPRQA